MDTSLGGASPSFPSTVWHVLDDLKHRRSTDPEAAMSQIVTRYWKPVYACVRLGWNLPNEDAKDLTQEFFVHLMESSTLQNADPVRGRFRAYLKTCLKNFLAQEHRRDNRMKRGGGTRKISLNVPDEAYEVSAKPGTAPDEVFDREWARTLVEEVVSEIAASLKAAGREDHWKILEAHDLAANPPNYQELGARFGISDSQVKHILQETRKRVRNSVILRIRDYALDEEEVWQELDYLMGLWKGS